MMNNGQNYRSENSDGCTSIRPFGFFRSFFAACSGTAPFELLSRHSLARIAWHLVLLALTFSLAVGYFLVKTERPRLAAAEQLFEESFGKDLTFVNGSVIPEKSIKVPQTLLMPGVGSLYYFPAPGAALPDRTGLNDLPYICVWTPGAVTLASVSGENSWFVSRWSISGVTNFSTSDMKEVFKFFPQVKLETENGFTMSTVEFFDVILNAYYIRVTVLHFFASFLLPLVYAAVLLMIVKFSIGRISVEPEPLRWWKTGIYAAFPGVFVGSCITALQLPFISFSTACMASTLVYGLHIILRMEYKKNNRTNGADNGKDE